LCAQLTRDLFAIAKFVSLIVSVLKTEKMAVVLLLLLNICVIQMTSSQSTYDIVQENDVNSCNSCERTERVLSQMQTALLQLVTVNTQIQTAVLQLRKDVAELRAANQSTVVKGLRIRALCNNSVLDYCKRN